MRPAAPGRRPGGGPPPTPPPAPPAHPRDPPAAARRPPGGGRGDGGEGRREVLFNFPLRYLLTIGLVPVFSLRWSLPPALGCIPKQPDSGKTRARRAGGRYRPHTVHGLGLDQKDLGPPRAAPGSGSSRVATSDLRSRLGGPARARGREGAREEGPEKGETRRPAADRPGPPPFPAHARHPYRPTDRPTDPRLPVAPPGGGGGGVVGARTGDGRTARPLSPPAPATAPAVAAGAPGREPRHGHSPGGGRAAAGRRRGVPRVAAEARVPGARTRTRTRPRARTARPDGARAAGRVAGKRARAADARRRGRHRRRGGEGGASRADRKTRPHPRHHHGAPPPPPRGARPSPTPDTPRGQQHPEAACGARTRSQGRRPTPEGPAGQGAGASARAHGPLLPSRGRHLPHGHRAFGGTPCLHLGGRRARRALRGQPPAAHPGGAIDRQATLRQA
ncbi:hypothetical protein R6Z07F_006299 [Ovis aries]